MTYSYNSLGFPTSAVDVRSGFNFATGTTYYDNGQLFSVVQGQTSSFAGITTKSYLNSRYQPYSRISYTPTQTLSNIYYWYGATGNNGNLLSVENELDSTRSVNYHYDSLSRLTRVQAGNWGDTYVYDSLGNLTQKNPISGLAGESLSVSVNPSTNQVNSITYDAAGQVTLDNIGNTWTYDAEGHPKTVGGSTYLYDGDGNRVMKSGTNARMYWPGPDGKVLNESDTSGNILIRNVYLNGNLVARRESNGNIHYPSLDHLGSARMVMNASGAVEDDIDYYPFGGQIVHASTSGNLYQFTGDETDTESSSLHTEFRQLSPSLGRWLRADPYNGSYDLLNPQSLNRYGYVGNNVLKYVDPSGLNQSLYGKNFEDNNGCIRSGVDESIISCWWDSWAGWGGGGNYMPYTPYPSGGGGNGQSSGQYGTVAPSNPPQVPHTCQQNRILNAVPGSTLTNPNDTVGTSVGGHNQFGINVTTAQLGAAGFTPFNPFGVSDGYHNGNVFFQVHDNGSGGLITQGHIDTFNPASGLFGFVGHSIWDVGIGTLLQHLFPHSHGLLDPGC